METAYFQICGRVASEDFRANTFNNIGKSPQLSLVCSGDECGIDSVDFSLDHKNGQRLLGGNIHSVIQTLTLWAGLAALHNMYDREMNIVYD
jgi:hypothetical protein